LPHGPSDLLDSTKAADFCDASIRSLLEVSGHTASTSAVKADLQRHKAVEETLANAVLPTPDD
jgi:hypothetical protein